MSAATFIYGEEALASGLGLPLPLLKKIRARDLAEGKDWALNRNRVAYTQRGAELVVAGLSPALPADDRVEVIKKSALDAVAELVVAAKVSRMFSNPHLVEVVLPDKKTARIRVRTTQALRVGTVLKVQAVAGTEDGYELAQRLPQSRLEARRQTLQAGK